MHGFFQQGLTGKLTHIMTNYEKPSYQICQAKCYNVHCRKRRLTKSPVAVTDQICISTELERGNDKKYETRNKICWKEACVHKLQKQIGYTGSLHQIKADAH